MRVHRRQRLASDKPVAARAGLGTWAFFALGSGTFAAAVAIAVHVCVVCEFPAQVAFGA